MSSSHEASSARSGVKAAIAILAVALYASPAAAWWWLCRIDDRTKYIRVDGEPIGSGSMALRTLIQKKTAKLLARTMELDCGDVTEKTPLESLGFVPDVKGTMESIDRIREWRADPIHELLYVLNLRKGKMNVPVSIALDDAVAEEALLELKERVDRRPVDARIGWENGVTIKDEKPGRILDLYGAITAIEDAVLKDGSASAVLPFIDAEPQITAVDLAQIDLKETVSSYETRFSRGGRDNASRAFNIELAAGRLDGTVLMPGKVISFNAIVGPRSTEAGFKEAPEIYEHELVPGVGGGVCQVASTLHAAAFLGGFEILERTSHSRPSSYIPMGLDATVIWPAADLKIRNPYPFPVMIKSSVEKNKLRVEIVGAAAPVKVVWWKRLLEEVPFGESIQYEDDIPVGTIITDQEGIDGYKLKKTRKIIFQDGTEKVETTIDRYPPTEQMLRMNYATPYTPAPPPAQAQAGEEPSGP